MIFSLKLPVIKTFVPKARMFFNHQWIEIKVTWLKLTYQLFQVLLLNQSLFPKKK